MASTRRLLGQILLEAGVMTQETLDAALIRAQRSRERIGEALIAMRAVSRDDVLRALATQVGLPFLSRRSSRPRFP